MPSASGSSHGKGSGPSRPGRRYRMAKGLTQKQLAEQMGVTYQAIQLWEKGTAPWPKHMSKLSEVLNVDSLQLMNDLQAWRRDEGKE